MNNGANGPLAGTLVLEMAGLGPAPFAALMLAELGATVVCIARKGAGRPFLGVPEDFDLDRFGRQTLAVDLKNPAGVDLVLKMAARADVLIEGFRPGVMERLGLGPETVQAVNPALVYGRMTGFGQHGPLSQRAGHDLTYLALTGALDAIGEKGRKPVPPLNLVADYGGGAMFLVTGVLAALLERSRSGKGQVIDAAMTDGASRLAAPYFSFRASGIWSGGRGENLLDSGTPFYDCYEAADGGHVAVACLEPQFFAIFASLLPLPAHFAARQYDPSIWPDMRAAIAARIAEKTRDEWADLFFDTDGCVAPVLSFSEAPGHSHNAARQTHITEGRFVRPAPAPRFSRSTMTPAVNQAATVRETLAMFGLDNAAADALNAAGVLGQ